MRWALTHPLGVSAATAGRTLADLPGRFEAPAKDALSAVAGDSARGRTALDRLAVYGGGYFQRLHGTLELEFPRLAEALGVAAFRELAASHLLRCPPSHPSLADLGESLTETLRIHPASVEAPWLVDVARIERATAEVWLSDVSATPPWTLSAEDDWEQVRLSLASGARLLRLAWDVGEWKPEQGTPPRRESWLLIWRVDASTVMESLDSRPGAVLEALGHGMPLGSACALAGSLGMSAEEVTQAFAHWTACGWLFPRPGGMLDDRRSP
jgi:hypothetical protein